MTTGNTPLNALAVRFGALCLSVTLVAGLLPLQAFADSSASDVLSPSDDIEEIVEEETPDADTEEGGFPDSAIQDAEELLSSELDGEGSVLPLSEGVDALVDFVYVDMATVVLGGEEQVAIGFSEPINAIEGELTIVKDDGATSTVPASAIIEDAMLFSISFSEVSQVGGYRLDRVSWDGDVAGSYDVPEPDSGMSFTVTEATGALEPEITISAIDEEGSLVELSSIPDALEESDEAIQDAGAAVAQSASAARTARATVAGASGTIVCALDPGHGGSDPGAVYGSLQEKNLTLKIARYCRTALQEYAGIEVVMTRDSDEYVGLTERVHRAKALGATLFVSIHVNSGGGTGFEVWIQNDSAWRYELHTEGEGLARSILDKLAALGLPDRGIKDKDATNGEYYPSPGGIADYFTVINESRRQNMPAILVEHGFIDNPTDYQKLSNESFLKQMGELDAEGIVDYYDLSKGPRPYLFNITNNGDVTLAWNDYPGATKYGISQYDNGVRTELDMNCTGTSYTIPGLRIGQEYTFLVQAYTDQGWTADSSSGRYTLKVIPTPSFTAQASGDGQVTLSWQPVSGAERYGISELMADGQYRAISRTAMGTSYTVSDLANGYEHRFLVQAYVGGSWSSPSTSLVKGATPQGTVKPGNVRASVSGSSVTLTWDPVPGAERYAVSSRVGSGDYVGHTRDAAGTSYTVAGLRAGTEYEFVVTAYIGVAGAWSRFDESDLVRVSLNGSSPGQSTAPSFTAQASGDGQVTLSWQPVSGAERYGISELMADGQYRAISRTAMGTSYTVSDLANGYEHRFLVQAYVGGSWSSPSTSLVKGATPQGTVKPGNVRASVSGSSVTLTWDPVPGAERYAVSSRVGSGDYVGHTRDATGTSYTVAGLRAGTEYEFVMTAYIGVAGAWSRFDESDLVSATVEGSLIMGMSQCSVDQMVAYYNSAGRTYPAATYSNYGAPTLRRFCELVYEQAAAEGVRAEVLFCQAMKETGWLQFGGQVLPTQCNFGGIGATDGGAHGATFPNVATGLLAQAQHLKAYATIAPLNQTCVDPRYHLVPKGCAPYVEILGQKENPTGHGWATAEGYGLSIVSMMKMLSRY